MMIGMMTGQDEDEEAPCTRDHMYGNVIVERTEIERNENTKRKRKRQEGNKVTKEKGREKWSRGRKKGIYTEMNATC